MKGVSLIIVMAVLVILGIVVMALVTLTSTQVKISHSFSDYKIAFHAAEAGLEYGIAGLPENTAPFPTPPDTWITLPNDAKYKSGMPDTLPTPIEVVGSIYLPGYSLETGAEFYNWLFDVTTSGKIKKSRKTLEARVSCGPIPGGTTY